MLKNILQKYGAVKATAIFSSVCIIASLAITALIWLMAGLPNLRVVLVVAFTCSAIIAPPVIYSLFKLTVDLEKSQRRVLLHDQKNFSLGVKAGSVAHDFNNFLSIINISISQALHHMDNKEKLTKYLTKMETVSNKAQALTKQLTTLSRETPSEKKPFNIADVIKETAGYAQKPENININLHLPKELWLVDIDGERFNQVFHNLIINATHAMPEGGDITISAENIVISSESMLPINTGNYVKVSISDKGCGIPENILNYIFDPYFTSKKDGDGLGLAITFSVIDGHNGYIEVESTEGEGATFNVFIPAQSKPK